MDIQSIAKKIITLCEKKAGATQAEAYLVTAKTSSVYIDDGIPKITDAKQETGVGVKFIIGKKIGYTSSTLLGETIEDVIARAKSIAQMSNEDEKFKTLPESKSSSIPIDKFYHKETAEIDSSSLMEKTMLLVNAATDDKVTVPNGVLRTSSIEFCVGNSLGVDARSKSTMVFGFFTAMSEDAGQVGEGVQRCWSRNIDSINFAEIGKKLNSQAKGVLTAQPFKERWEDITTVIAPSEGSELIITLIGSVTSGENVNTGSSPWADKIGEAVAYENITIVDNGLSDMGLLSSSVDDEGTPSQTTSLVVDGVLKSYILDSYNAGQMDLPSTGNGIRRNPRDAQGRFTFAAGCRATTLELKPGTKSFDEVIGEIKRGVFVEHFAYPNVDPVTGAFSNEIRNACLIENGELTSQVKYALWVGNLFESLKKEVLLTSDVEVHNKCVLPTVAFSGTELVGQ
ncbi:MAG: TldD/PmbA family protein [Candidatus Hodarchaeota archaeon]